MAIFLNFTTYLYAMLYGEPEHADRIGYVDDKSMKSTKFYLSFFTRKPLEMGLLFIYCASLACFAS